MLFVFFFFFKHKTAYEFVDCDWSSVVCSSDLLDTIVSGNLTFDSSGDISFDSAGLSGVRVVEIGSASCRERV